MNTITWLHVSDLHFRTSQAYDANVVLRALLRDVAERIEQEGLQPDFLAVSGDIAFSGQPAEYDLARRFFDDLLRTTELPKERLFLVPGNHDVNRSLVSRGAQGIGDSLTDRKSANAVLSNPRDRRLMFARFEGYAAFVNDYLGGHSPFDDEHYFYVRTLDLAGRRIALLGLNSAWLCASDEDKANGLLIGERQARAALEGAEGAGLKIALLHHPFDWLREFDQDDSAAMLLDSCDFILHGHLHRAAMAQLISPDSGAMVIAGGACYETRQYPNSYNFCRLDLAAGSGTVYLRRYSDRRGGFWAKDVMTYRNVPDGVYTFALRGSGAKDLSRGYTPADTETIAAYLEVVRAQCSRMETRPYRQLSELRGAPPRLSLLGEGDLAGVYVPLRFDLHPSRAGLESGLAGDEPHGRMEMERDLSRTDAGLAEVLSTPGHLVFIGAAGCCKTTILRLVAAVLAAQDSALARDELALDDGAEPLPRPVFVALRDFEHTCQTSPRTYRRDVDGLLRFMDDHFQRWHPGCVPPGFLSELVRTGRAWLLLDALDEVADFDHRIAVRQVIERLADGFPGNRLLVTARVAAYASANTRLDERFHLAAVRDLTRDQWAPLVERLYTGLEAGPGVAAERARRLLARMDASPLLQEMVKTPLMVWTATLIHYADRELPEQRAELYNAYVDVLLGERLHEEESAEAAQRLRGERWPVEDRRLYLTYAAYEAHRGAAGERTDRQRDALVVVDEHDLVRRILAPFMADYLGLDDRRKAEREAAAFVELMAERSGLLHAHEEGYSFGDHLTVQEFLTASYLVDDLRDQSGWPDFLRTHAGQTWWREVFLLAAGYLLRQPRQARRFLLDELGDLPGDDDARAYGLAWAGRALLEIPPRRVGWHANARDELARRLLGVLWQNPPTTSVAARVEAGDVLGRLGDPRFQGDLRLPEFISLPGERFWMGSNEAEIERLVQQTDELAQGCLQARAAPPPGGTGRLCPGSLPDDERLVCLLSGGRRLRRRAVVDRSGCR